MPVRPLVSSPLRFRCWRPGAVPVCWAKVGTGSPSAVHGGDRSPTLRRRPRPAACVQGPPAGV